MKRDLDMQRMLQRRLEMNPELVIGQLPPLDDDTLVLMIENDQDLSLYTETYKMIPKDKYEEGSMIIKRMNIIMSKN